MGILNDMKKLLFGAKAVGKSAAEKAVEKAEDLGDKLKDKAEDVGEKLKDKTEDVVEKAKDIVEDVGDKILDAGEKVYHSAKDFAEGVTKDVFGKDEPAPQKPAETPPPAGTNATQQPITDPDSLLEAPETTVNPLIEKARETAEKVGEQVMETGKEAMKTFKSAAEKAKDKFEELFEKAQEEAAKEESESSIVKDAKKTVDETTSTMDEFTSKAKEFADEPPKTNPKLSQSELTGKDDFFEKAKRFAEGDYHNTGKKKKEGEITLSKDPDHPANKKDKEKGDIKGFDDHDGDGDSLIDDAIIDEGNDPK